MKPLVQSPTLQKQKNWNEIPYDYFGPNEYYLETQNGTTKTIRIREILVKEFP
jgi:hypothetical protein